MKCLSEINSVIIFFYSNKMIYVILVNPYLYIWLNNTLRDVSNSKLNHSFFYPTMQDDADWSTLGVKDVIMFVVVCLYFTVFPFLYSVKN